MALPICDCSARLLLRPEGNRIAVFTKSDWAQVGVLELNGQNQVLSLTIAEPHRRKGLATEILSLLNVERWATPIAAQEDAAAIAWLTDAGFTSNAGGWQPPAESPGPARAEDDYPERVRRWHQTLGIERDYAQRRGLDPVSEPAQLAHVGPDCFDRALYLQPSAAEAWKELQRAAREAGVTLEPVSGFRSLDYQGRILKRNLDEGRRLEDLLAVSAAPGFSEHHSGRALDMSSPTTKPLDESFETTPEFRWLRDHASAFGFRMSFPRNNRHGFIYEPWHWAFAAADAPS
ncbi:MAG: M15 family metallopeptidase [Pseudomonadota bacterium]